MSVVAGVAKLRRGGLSTPHSCEMPASSIFFHLRRQRKLLLQAQPSEETPSLRKLPVVGVADAMATALTHELTSVRKGLAEMPRLVLQQAHAGAESMVLRAVKEFSEAIKLSAKEIAEAFNISQIGIVDQMERMLEMLNKANDRICKAEEVSEELRKKLQHSSLPPPTVPQQPCASTPRVDIEDDAVLDGLSEGARWAVLAQRRQRYNELPLGEQLQADWTHFDSDDSEATHRIPGCTHVPPSMDSDDADYVGHWRRVPPELQHLDDPDLIVDSTDEDRLDGLSEDERCDLLEERYDAVQMLPVEQRYVALQRVVKEQWTERHFL